MHQTNKSDVHLISYAQRRTQYKQNTELSLNRTAEQPFLTSNLSVNRSTANFPSDLMKLRDIRKAVKLPEDKSREEILFGELDSFDQARINRKLTSRNKLVGRHTYNFEKEVEDIDNLPDDWDSLPEEDFDLNINEHDEEILLKSVDVHHKALDIALNKIDKEGIKRALDITEIGLEVIKETEDVIISPSKNEIVQSKLKAPNNKYVKSHKEDSNGTTKLEFKGSNNNTGSKIMRRNTVSLKPPTILNGPKTLANVSKLQSKGKAETKIAKPPMSPYSGKRINAKSNNESQESMPVSKQKSSIESKFGFNNWSKPDKNYKNKTVINSPAMISTSKSKSPDENKVSPKSKEIIIISKAQTTSYLQKVEDDKKEEKRKMMAERKLQLKKKLSAIKIQKFWRARQRRRQLKLKHLALISAVRRIQRFYQRILKRRKLNTKMLENCRTNHLDKILKIQRYLRKRKTIHK